MSPQTNQYFFCTLASAAAEEQLFGTASKGEVWFLLEYRPHWEAEPFEASHLPAPVKELISGYLKTIPGFRLHFIKQQPPTANHLTLYVALTREIGPTLYKFPFSRYEELLRFDVSALLQDPANFEGYMVQEPVYLTCTHGRHDKCCAKFGRPVAKALADLISPNAWQASHLGGDRFAANVVCFPHGLYYGRVQPDEVETIVSSYQLGKIYLEKLRGRACYNFLTQVADYYLRRETGNLDLPGFHSLGGKKLAEEVWAFQFQDLTTHQGHTITVRRHPGAVRNFLTCKSLKEGRVAQYELVSHRAG